MGQLTPDERKAKVLALYSESVDAGVDSHRLPLKSTGGEQYPVIEISADDLLLNPESHRIQSALDDDPDWPKYKDDPFGEDAQKVIERAVEHARGPGEFETLKRSLEEGQQEPGVVKRSGVLVNANTRAVAFRQFEDPTRRRIRVAVLPEVIDDAEIGLMEYRLQMQKDLKEPYTLTNQLRFMRDLKDDNKLTYKQIAKETWHDAEDEKRGEKLVQTRLTGLTLIEAMREIPSQPLQYKFFDKAMSDQHVDELVRRYNEELESSPEDAADYLRAYLLALQSGVTQVRQLRLINSGFLSEYAIPQIDENDVHGAQVRRVAESSDSGEEVSDDMDLLGGESAPNGATNAKALIDALANDDKWVELGSDTQIEQSDFRNVLRAAIESGIDDHKAEINNENKLDRPAANLKSATDSIAKCMKALDRISQDPEFDDKRARTLEFAYKKLRKSERELGEALEAAGVIGEH